MTTFNMAECDSCYCGSVIHSSHAHKQTGLRQFGFTSNGFNGAKNPTQEKPNWSGSVQVGRVYGFRSGTVLRVRTRSGRHRPHGSTASRRRRPAPVSGSSAESTTTRRWSLVLASLSGSASASTRWTAQYSAMRAHACRSWASGTVSTMRK